MSYQPYHFQSATTEQLTFEDPPPSVSSVDILELLWMSLRLRPIFLRPRGAMARANRSELRLLSCSLSSNISAATTAVDSLSLMHVGVFGVETHVELRSWRGKPPNLWKQEHLINQHIQLTSITTVWHSTQTLNCSIQFLAYWCPVICMIKRGHALTARTTWPWWWMHSRNQTHKNTLSLPRRPNPQKGQCQ